jgi:hypothetical protein
MGRRMGRTILVVLWLCGGLACGQSSKGAGAQQSSLDPPGTIIHTFVYREITSLPRQFANMRAVLSASGNRVVFAEAPGLEPQRTNHISVINADGTGMVEVDTYQQLCGCGVEVDISGDGARVVSTDSTQIRVASAGGGGGRPLVTLTSNEIVAIRISGDGSKVFFSLGRDAVLTTGTPLPSGVYVVNAEGGEPRRIVGTSEIATLLGLPPAMVPFGASNPNALSVSHDGTRIAFETFIQPEAGGVGQGVFFVNVDGSALTSITGRHATAALAMSGDGSTVAYQIKPFDAAGEVGMINTTTRRVLSHWANGAPPPFPTGFPRLGEDRLVLSFNGAKLLLGSTGVLMDTASGTTLQLAARGGWTTGDPAPLLSDGMFNATMDGTATQFLYMAADAQNIQQLATMMLDPPQIGDAPMVANVAIDPAFVLAESRSSATLTALVSTTQMIVRVSGAVLRSGLVDNDFPNGNLFMLDDGNPAFTGDQKAGDGIFTNNGVRYGATAAGAGPRTVRVKAEARSTDGRRHVTAIEVQPFEVRP